MYSVLKIEYIMLYLTKQERNILSFIAATMLLGSCLHYAAQKYPLLRKKIDLINSDKLYPKTDINSASFDELIKVPYIGKYTANQIIQFRNKYNGFTSLEQLKQIKGIRKTNYEKFYKYLIVGPYKKTLSPNDK